MKTTTILRFVLALGLLPAALSAQSTSGDTAPVEPVNYFSEFADLMHEEMEAEPAPVAAPSPNRFPAFIHFREVLKGQPEDFPAYYETLMSHSLCLPLMRCLPTGQPTALPS